MKPTKIRVMPARPGMNLRHPVSGLLPDGGRRWIDDSFTRRRIADGGVMIVPDDANDKDEAEQMPAAPTQAAAPAVAPLAPKPVAAVAPAATKPA